MDSKGYGIVATNAPSSTARDGIGEMLRVQTEFLYSILEKVSMLHESTLHGNNTGAPVGKKSL